METRTAGSASGLGKRTSSNAGTAPQADSSSWRQRDAIFGGCADYRAAALVDVRLDEADLDRTVDCPALVVWGEKGGIARLFDIAELWAPRLSRMHTATLPGGHFFIEQFPEATAEILRGFLVSAGSAS